MASYSRHPSNWPGFRRALEIAQLSLAAPPGEWLISITKSRATQRSIAKRVRYIERHEPKVCPPEGPALRAVLPLAWCPNNNVLTRAHRGTKTTLSKRIVKALLEQNRFCKPEIPLPGRPLVRFIQFSIRDPDEDSSFTKVPLDVLHTGRRGGGKHHFGLFDDDNRQAINLRAWWEPTQAKAQFVYLDVWRQPCA